VPSSHHRRLATGLALSLALVGVAAACGDDDSDAASSSTSTPVATVSTEACDAYTALSGALAGDPGQAASLVTSFQQTAPADLRDDAQTIGDAYAALADGGEPTVFGEPAFARASGKVADAYFDACDLSAELDVDGIDYGFEGLPAKIEAGRVGIRFTNRSEHGEAHEMVLMKRNEGATESVEELLALPEDQVMTKLTPAGVVFADQPEGQAVSMLDLEPGKYVAVCFIPVGGGEDGMPHAMAGMTGEMEVVG
jgi:hypothetical protein